jgi:radical SAM superfamily enzyme YgiQ (UPF0313 family)
MVKIIMRPKVQVYLADITYFNSYTSPQITIPLNIGFIKAYANKFFSDYFEFKLFKDPKKLIKEIHQDPPDILGLSCYYWNMQFDVYAANIAKKQNPNVIVIAGGPQIDFKHGDMSFKEEQIKLHAEFNQLCDFYVINEGELAFNNFLERFLEVGPEKVFDEPINGGVHFINDEDYLGDTYLGADLDLDELPSPILSGILDEFLIEDFMPTLQTSRLCPYKCTFCSSGKLRGKLRAFSKERVFNEIDYISDIYKKFPYKRIWITDENFGILKRDIEIAEYLYQIKKEKGYPQGVKVYFDKKFQLNSRKASVHLADMESDGVTLAFQTLNKETLKAIKRINLADDEIDEIIKWARKNGFPVSTQLIQGLPYETKETFMESIEYLIQKRVNSLGIFQCMVLKGAELNRRSEREKYGFKTMWRPCYLPSYDEVDGEFICEAEEIVVSNKWMSFDDYLALNKIGFACYLLTVAEYYSRVINYLIENTDVIITELFHDIMNPADRDLVESSYRRFLDDYDKERVDELSETFDEAKQKMKNSFMNANNQVGEPSRLNVKFASRLIYRETWFARVLLSNLEDKNLTKDDMIILRDLIHICELEWVDLLNIHQSKSLSISGLTHKYLGTVKNYNLVKPHAQHDICFMVTDEQSRILDSYMNRYSKEKVNTQDYSNNALDYISPRRRLRYEQISIVNS